MAETYRLTIPPNSIYSSVKRPDGSIVITVTGNVSEESWKETEKEQVPDHYGDVFVELKGGPLPSRSDWMDLVSHLESYGSVVSYDRMDERTIAPSFKKAIKRPSRASAYVWQINGMHYGEWKLSATTPSIDSENINKSLTNWWIVSGAKSLTDNVIVELTPRKQKRLNDKSYLMLFDRSDVPLLPHRFTHLNDGNTSWGVTAQQLTNDHVDMLK